MEEKPTCSHVGELVSNVSITDDILSDLVRVPFNTISILKTYAFPKISQYYSSKGQTCILDKYHDDMMQYFITNNINIEKFYNSSINKSEFVSSALTYINQKNRMTENSHHYDLQRSIKKLYTILQLHQHINHKQCLSKPILDMHVNDVIDIQTAVEPTRRKLRKQTSAIQHQMVHELSRSKSQVLTLQQSNDILKEVADETQRKLIDSEQEVSVYKDTVNQLQQQLESEKIKMLNMTEKKEEILSVNRKLSHKMDGLEDENQKLKELLCALQNSISNKGDNFNGSEENKTMPDVNIANSVNSVSSSNDNDIEDLSLFCVEKKVKMKKNFWDELLSGLYKCVPSFD